MRTCSCTHALAFAVWSVLRHAVILCGHYLYKSVAECFNDASSLGGEAFVCNLDDSKFLRLFLSILTSALMFGHKTSMVLRAMTILSHGREFTDVVAAVRQELGTEAAETVKQVVARITQSGTAPPRLTGDQALTGIVVGTEGGATPAQARFSQRRFGPNVTRITPATSPLMSRNVELTERVRTSRTCADFLRCVPLCPFHLASE